GDGDGFARRGTCWSAQSGTVIKWSICGNNFKGAGCQGLTALVEHIANLVEACFGGRCQGDVVAVLDPAVTLTCAFVRTGRNAHHPVARMHGLAPRHRDIALYPDNFRSGDGLL